MSWEPDRGTIFYIIDRKSGEIITKFKTEAFFAFHVINSFESGDGIVVDIIVYPVSYYFIEIF